MNRRPLAIVAVVLSTWVATLSAQEIATDAEKTWRELRDSEDVRTKLLAERWYNAIRLQDWTNDTGKFTTKAKYVAHDPDLKWVKLRVVQGSGDKRVVKDVTIPLEKLNKTCQSRVRQINVLTAKMAEAATAEDDKESDEATDIAAGEMPGEREMVEGPRGGRGEYGAGLAGMEAEQVLADDGRPEQEPSEASAPSQPVVVTNNGPPLPALLPPLPANWAELAPQSSSTDEHSR